MVGRKLTACCHERPARTIALLLGGNRGRHRRTGTGYKAQTRLLTTVARQATECPIRTRGGTPEVEERRRVGRTHVRHLSSNIHTARRAASWTPRPSAVKTILHVVINER